MAQARPSTSKFARKAWYPLMTDWETYLKDPSAGLISRKCLYLSTPQIFNALLKSNEIYKDRIHFNLNSSINVIEKFIADKNMLNEIFEQYCDKDDYAKKRCVIMALTGWRCIS